MQEYFGRIKFVLLILLLLLFCYADCRILFYFFNLDSFPDTGFSGLIQTLFYGVRFDLSALLYINSLFLVLTLFPVSFFRQNYFRLGLKTLFLVTNFIGILANCSDFAYFSFTHKRTTYDVFAMMGTQADMTELLPLFVADFWYVFLIAFVFVWILHLFYNLLFKRFLIVKEPEQFTWKVVSVKSVVFIIISGLTVIGMRGGLQLIPLGIVNAGDQVNAERIPLVLNTPFSIMQSMQLTDVEEKHYFSEAECRTILNPCKKVQDTGAFRPLNVVIIILESFSKEYTKLSGKASYTPFLDSMMNEGLNFTNAYANSKRSIEGIPAIISATPSMQEAYLNTVYANNRLSSLPLALKEKGYTTSFFHGGNNGTMSFDSYCAMAGFDEYYGRNEYADERDYDGSWGIWDEPFFQRFASELSKKKEPFLSTIFSLSSHHPFALPDKYKSVFQEGSLPVHKTVRYTDYSLKKFFDTAKKQKWFKNTLFVITADHTGPAVTWADEGNFEIPLLLYHSGAVLKGNDTLVAQQMDIMAGVLSYLNYDREFYSLGNNLLGLHGNAINYNNERYQLFYNSGLIKFSDNNDQAWFYTKEGNALKESKTSDKSTDEELKMLKAIIQTYNNSLIRNNAFCK